MSNLERRAIRNLKVILKQFEKITLWTPHVELDVPNSRHLNLGGFCLPDIPGLHIAFRHEPQRDQVSFRDKTDDQRRSLSVKSQ